MHLLLVSQLHLNFAIYLFFTSYAIIIVISIAIFLPLVARIGEAISGIPRKMRIQTKTRYVFLKTIKHKEYFKKAVALRPIRFSYGSYYPLGKKFARNVFDNMVQNLLSIILLFEISGRRHK